MKKKTVTGLLLVICFIFIEGILSFSTKRNAQFEAELLSILSEVIVGESQDTSSVVDTQQVLGESTLATVTRVIDGDTIELESGDRVRYIGINSPETVNPRKEIECFGKESSKANKELVQGKVVRLEKDVTESDRYGRKLRYVFLQEDDTEIFVNEHLVLNGYSFSSKYPPDVKYQDLLDTAQNKAKKELRGLWGETCLRM